MESVFPFGFPEPTALYLVLYVASFAFHQALMHYVLAGSIYVSWATVAPGRADAPRSEQPLATLLRDWMPFVLSAAITAGVAPLLFVQITHPRHFYTANLLLSWRWMNVIPVLIVAFYLLYLGKSSAISRWPYVARVAVVLLVAWLFLFVGFCWTANHLIANSESAWPEIYSSGDVLISPVAVGLRMLIWIGGAFPSMAVIAGWQLVASRTSASSELIAVEMRRLALFALGGLGLASAAAAGNLIRSDEAVRGLTFGVFSLPYTIATFVGVVVQVVAWVAQLRVGTNRWLLASASFGCVFGLVGISVMREAVRVASIDVATLYSRHADAGAIGGFSVFLAFAALNTGLIAGCILLVRRGLTTTASK